MKVFSLVATILFFASNDVAAFSIHKKKSSGASSTSFCMAERSDSMNESRRAFVGSLVATSASLAVGLTSVEVAKASGGATAGGAYLLSAKQRYNERVRGAVKGLLSAGEALAAGDSKPAKAYFASEEAGSWKDLTAAGYLLSNAFRRSSTTAPDSLPAVKKYKAFAAQVDSLQKVLKKKGAEAASGEFAKVEEALDTWLAEIELPLAREL